MAIKKYRGDRVTSNGDGRLVFSLRQGLAFFSSYFDMNANKRLREGSSSSRMSESIQQSLDSNFAEAMSEINSLRADVNAQLSIVNNKTDDLKTSLDAAWVEIEVLKQQDEQNKVQLTQLETDNARLQAEVSAAKARAVKLENYTRQTYDSLMFQKTKTKIAKKLYVR